MTEIVNKIGKNLSLIIALFGAISFLLATYSAIVGHIAESVIN